MEYEMRERFEARRMKPENSDGHIDGSPLNGML